MVCAEAASVSKATNRASELRVIVMVPRNFSSVPDLTARTRKSGQKKGGKPALFLSQRELAAVVQIELDRVGRHANLVHFFHLQGQVGIDPVVGEDTTLGQEVTILVQGSQGLFQGSADGRNLCIFFRRQIVQVLGSRIARVDLVLNTVQAGHQQGREAQVRIGDRIREAGFDTASLGRGNERDTDGSGTVLGGVGQLDRGFVVRNQTLVGVGTGVGDRVQGLGVLDDAADVEQGGFGQAGVAVTGEQVLAVLPDGLVNVHAGTVVANDGLRHEGGGFAVLVGNVVHHVLQHLGLVGTLDQGVEDGTDFALASVGHFVVGHFDRAADGFQGQDHGGADVVQAVDRRNREVAALDGRTVAGGTANGVVLLTGAPGGFGGIDLQRAAGHVDRPFDAVENEEFGFRAEVGGIANTGGLQVGFGALGDGARIAVVAATVGGVNHVAGQDHGGLVEERVDVGGVGIRHQDHVGSLDTLPAGNGRAVESVTVFELVFVKGG